ncbi:MAG: excalibur calcium-binding domain-containing protein [Alphaproteobacteria bacterium]
MFGRISLALLLIVPAPAALAHGGGLNAEGCHNNRKTGDYHCHRSSSPPPSTARQSQRPAIAPRGAFRNCAEARAAGAAPVLRGDPGYGVHLDRDRDGIGCE